MLGSAQDIAVRVGPYVERTQPRPDADHGPDLIAVALIHPNTLAAAAHAHRYTRKGWLRCETAAILVSGSRPTRCSPALRRASTSATTSA
ncbi:hypothetical protein ABZY81_34630 [Streptomyces sp. NPDC006514]|uniref:hypothetical protein n=1 Tax=Streptomyces sp. NPDC006514 TaxID=3154308 RepID=UPI0033B21B47